MLFPGKSNSKSKTALPVCRHRPALPSVQVCNCSTFLPSPSRAAIAVLLLPLPSACRSAVSVLLLPLPSTSRSAVTVSITTHSATKSSFPLFLHLSFSLHSPFLSVTMTNDVPNQIGFPQQSIIYSTQYFNPKTQSRNNTGTAPRQMHRDSNPDTSSTPIPSSLVSPESSTHSLSSRAPLSTSTEPVLSPASSPLPTHSQPLPPLPTTPAPPHRSTRTPFSRTARRQSSKTLPIPQKLSPHISPAHV